MAKGVANTNALGSWAFLIGVVLALVFALPWFSFSGLGWLLVVLGIIVGLLNVKGEEVHQFLYSGVVLVIVSALSGTGFNAVSPYLGATMANLMTLFVPATIIVALKNVYTLAKN